MLFNLYTKVSVITKTGIMRIQIIENYELKTIQKCLTETKSNGYMNMMQQDLNE